MFIRTPYNYDMSKVSSDTALVCHDDTRAKQSFKNECDINNIVRQFGVTGLVPNSVVPPTYGDFSGVFDYHTALDSLLDAQDAFNALPATLRARFSNDPSQLIKFLETPENRLEAEKLGLVRVTAPVEKSLDTPPAVE